MKAKPCCSPDPSVLETHTRRCGVELVWDWDTSFEVVNGRARGAEPLKPLEPRSESHTTDTRVEKRDEKSSVAVLGTVEEKVYCGQELPLIYTIYVVRGGSVWESPEWTRSD